MEQPDANGYVNVRWPSKSIPHGGIFHTRRIEASTENQQFLKVLLEESKLSIAQRQKSAFRLRHYDEPRTECYREEVPMVRPRTSRRRSLSAIRESGIFDVDPYKPMKRGEDREKLKERLVNTMAYGDTPLQVIPPPPRQVKEPPKLPSNKEQWHELIGQIRERAEWLEEMELLGHADRHREIIKDQIAERLRALDALNIESQCSSARSDISKRSREMQNASARSNCTVRTQKSSDPQKPIPNRGRQKSSKKQEENVAAYGQFTPLKYSPRRRV